MFEFQKKQNFAKAVPAKNQKNPITLEDNRAKSLIQKKANKTGLPDQLKNGIENLSGHSLDDVKVHYNSPKPAQLSAHAFAQGSQIHVASGQEKHLPHETWHVIQQKQGRVKPTKKMNGSQLINDDRSLENEADVMGNKALGIKQLKSFEEKPATVSKPILVQLKGGGGKKKGGKTPKKKESGVDRSYNNLGAYRPGWVRKNNVTREHIAAFQKTYKSGIRGHASGTSEDKEQGNTTTDCNAFKSWFTGLYGWK